MTTEELQASQLQIQKMGMYIGIASLIISALSLYWASRVDRK